MKEVMMELSIPDMLEKCLKQGFSLESISLVTKLSKDDLQKIRDNTICVSDNSLSITYLGIFLAQLYYVSPTELFFFHEILNALTNQFKISRMAIANYVGISQEELNIFIDSPENIQNRREIELKILHLFTTFIRDKRYSLGDE